MRESADWGGRAPGNQSGGRKRDKEGPCGEDGEDPGTGSLEANDTEMRRRTWAFGGGNLGTNRKIWRQ
jgi:hypothetical protein